MRTEIQKSELRLEMAWEMRDHILETNGLKQCPIADADVQIQIDRHNRVLIVEFAKKLKQNQTHIKRLQSVLPRLESSGLVEIRDLLVEFERLAVIFNETKSGRKAYEIGGKLSTLVAKYADLTSLTLYKPPRKVTEKRKAIWAAKEKMKMV